MGAIVGQLFKKYGGEMFSAKPLNKGESAYDRPISPSEQEARKVQEFHSNTSLFNNEEKTIRTLLGEDR